jgi:quinolinate synthase
MHVDCEPRGRTWNFESCRAIAPLTLEINRLKREKDAVILAHSYVEPESDPTAWPTFHGGFLLPERPGAGGPREVIVFAGVVFMAETAKILSPGGDGVVPDRGSGCSLADSITGADLRRLKSLYPDATVVCYINSTAEVKAESDVCVTSGNVYAIVAGCRPRRILFVPDRLMAENIREELRAAGRRQGDHLLRRHLHRPRPVHAGQVAEARAQFPGLKVVAHPECPPEVAAASDFVGSTGAMMKYVKIDRRAVLPHADGMRPGRPPPGRGAREEFHRRLPALPLHEAQHARKDPRRPGAPRPDQIVTLDPGLSRARRRCIERMFALAPAH